MPSLSPSIQERLARTWPVFFARHGNLTRTQQAAIPPILGGQNTLLIAPTATGKTEAVIAPLVERHLLAEALPAQGFALRILYICPTRALVRDLYERLLTPLTSLGVSLMMKSGDTGPVPVKQPPTILITTPESLDSLLTRAPRLFASVQAIVLDEIHLFDGTPRGDHLCCLLRRIDHIRAYQAQAAGHPTASSLQRIALSATVANPQALGQRYLLGPKQSEAVAIVQIAGVRQISGTLRPLSNLHDLIAVLDEQMVGASQVRKTLIFCNARHEVEQIAAYLREHLPFETTVFVHYSNLDATLRREVEEGLAQASTAICVCTSTLELGIDIGSIDMVVLVGPPPTPAAFVQRIGRAGRRRRKAQVVGMVRSPLEEVRFQALFRLTEQAAPNNYFNAEHSFYRSVLIQQIFSILKQSPTGGIRLADLRRVTPDSVEDETLRHLFNHLVSVRYLKVGRPGEWKAGAALAELIDEHEIYSNIGTAPQPVVVVDAYTGRAIAQSERLYAPGETLFVGGRLMEVVWRAQYRLGVRVLGATRRQRGDRMEAELRARSVPFAVSVEVSQMVATLLGLSPNQMMHLQTEAGSWLFHFWGDLYGELLAQMLRAHLAAEMIPGIIPGVTSGGEWDSEEDVATVTRANEHCLRLSAITPQLPLWNEQNARRQLLKLLPRLEPLLELGRFHALLPPDLATEAIVAQVDMARFEQLYLAATIIQPNEAQRKQLLHLLE